MMWLWGILSASNTDRRMVCGAWKDNNGVPCTIIPIPESDRKVIFSTEVEGLYDYRARDLMSLSDATKLFLRGHHKRTMQGTVWPPQGDVSTLALRGTHLICDVEERSLARHTRVTGSTTRRWGLVGLHTVRRKIYIYITHPQFLVECNRVVMHKTVAKNALTVDRILRPFQKKLWNCNTFNK